MVTIVLSRGEWQYDDAKPLGQPGGFGEVFEGIDSQARSLAVKRFYSKAEQAAGRELTIAAGLLGLSHPHVIQILDCGRDAATGRSFIVMPRANRSLSDFLKAGRPERAVALEILDAIGSGLEELGTIVSRDLKPSNVLEHDGVWKIADFGLGRTEGATTTEHTMRGAMTCAYAAPELWLMKRPTKATDVYALGCIAFEMLAGRLPFMGPTESDYREQHLNQAPPDFQSDPRLQQLVRLCLSKAPEARPSVERVLKSIRRVSEGGSPATPSPLSLAGAAIAVREAESEATTAQAAHAKQTLEQIAVEGQRQFNELVNSLADAVQVEAPVARRHAKGIDLGNGSLKWDLPFRSINASDFTGTGWNIVSGGYLEVLQRDKEYLGRSANLWYARAPTESDFRWWEISYMVNPFLRDRDRRSVPFAFMSVGKIAHAAACLQQTIGNYQLATKPKKVDDECFDDFVKRWSNWLAAAAQGGLQYPRVLPEPE